MGNKPKDKTKKTGQAPASRIIDLSAYEFTSLGAKLTYKTASAI